MSSALSRDLQVRVWAAVAAELSGRTSPCDGGRRYGLRRLRESENSPAVGIAVALTASIAASPGIIMAAWLMETLVYDVGRAAIRFYDAGDCTRNLPAVLR